MTAAPPDLTTTLFILPKDAKFLPVAELSARIQARIGPIEAGQSVITRPGFRVTTRLLPGPLAALINEFRVPSLLTDAVVRFAQAHEQDASTILDLAFDALATLIEARILVPQDSPEVSAPEPSLAAGQEFAGFEIEALVRSLEDSEVYRASGPGGVIAALKISRDDRPDVVAKLVNEARILEHLGGTNSPRLLEGGSEGGRAYIAMEWCDGVSIAVAAQQARAARDRYRLHGLVGRMFDAYGWLHAQGVLHGDIHPGNCLVRGDGHIVILDFGNARLLETAGTVDPLRSGIPQFYDPQMATALLAGRIPPPVTPQSEQFALAVLAYVLLTGLQPIHAPAVRDELLRAIIQKPTLPFAARGVAAWPEVEGVVGRALAKQPEDRFSTVASLAQAFSVTALPNEMPIRWPDTAQGVLDAALEAIRTLKPSAEFAESIWFGLRAALALEDAELLAATDILVRRAEPGWAVHSLAALVARAQSDSQMESKAIAQFLAAAEQLPDGSEVLQAILAAANLLEGTLSRSPDVAKLAEWAVDRLGRFMLAAPSRERAAYIAGPLLTYCALSLAKTGVVAPRTDLPERLETLRKTDTGNVWLWALAHDVFADDQYMALALAARLSSKPLKRGFAMMRLYQVTGKHHWIADANRVLARAVNTQLPALAAALFMVEMMAPENAILPPFLFPFSTGQVRRSPGFRLWKPVL